MAFAALLALLMLASWCNPTYAAACSTQTATVASGGSVTFDLGPTGANCSIWGTSGIVQQPSHGNLNGLGSGGSGDYTVVYNNDGLGAPSDTFTVLDDGLASGTPAPIVFNVSVIYSPPVVAATSVNVAYNSSANPVTLVLSGSAATSVAIGTVPAHGAAFATGTSITYTPTAGYNGPDSFTYTATNAGGTSAPAAVSVTMTAPTVTVSPVSTALAATVGTAFSQTFSATGGSGTYAFQATGTLPNGITFNTAQAKLSGIPTQSGTFSVTIAATDSSAGTAVIGSRTYTMNVAAPTISISMGAVTLERGVSASLQATASGGIGSYSYAVTGGALPPGLSLTPGTGAITGTPTTAGAYSFTLTATDSYSFTGSHGYSGTVGAGVPIASAVNSTVAYNSSGSSYSINASTSGPAATSLSVSTQPLHGSVSVLSATLFSYTPTVGYAGADSFTYTATNAVGTSAAATVSITVSPPTLALAPSSTSLSGTFGAAYSQVFSASGGVPTYVYAQTGSLPIGLTFNAGTLSGTPIQVGTFNFTVTVVNDGSTGTSTPFTTFRNYTLTVGAPTLSLSPASLPQLEVGVSYSQQISTSGGISPYTYVFTGGVLPPGLSITSAGLISGIPFTAGTYGFTVTSTDGFGYSTSASYSGTVGPGKPVTANSSAAVGYSSANNAIGVSTTGGTPTALNITTAAGHGSAVVNGVSGFTYTPTAGYSGTDTFSYTATNAVGTSAVATITLTVTPQIPVANAALATVAYTSGATTITPTFAGGTATSLTIASPPAHGTASVSGLTLIYTPSANYSGNDSFTYTATNAGGTSAAATVTLTVTPQIPVANAASATVTYASSANVITPTLSGGTASSLTIASQPAYGTASASGLTLIYTPSANYSGSDSFTYTATNTGGTSTAATVTIAVTEQIPLAGNVSLTVEADSKDNAVPLALTGGVATGVAIASAPAHGTAAVIGTHITYTPSTGYSGADSFTYTASNSSGSSAVASVSITVQTRPDPSKDQEVIGLINAQVNAAKYFALTQISNFQSHLESLHRRKDAQNDTAASKAQFPNSRQNPAPEADSIATISDTPSTRSSAWSMSSSTSAQTGQILVDNTRLDVFAPQVKKSSGAMSLPWSSLSLAGTQKNILGTGLEIWSAGVINLGNQGNTDTRFTTSGLSIGTDKRINDTLVLGTGVGFGHERQKIGDNGTRNTGDNYAMTVYGSYQSTDGFFVDGLLGYGHLQFEAQRYVTTTGGIATSSRMGSQWFSSLSGGYEYEQGKQLLISPYTRLDLVSTRLDQTTESGADRYNLNYSAQNVPTTKISFGLRAETNFKLGEGITKPYFRLEYQHDFEKPGIAEMRYADQLSGPVYQLESYSSDRNATILGLGNNYVFHKTWAFGMRYQFSYSATSSTRTNSLSLNLTNKF